MVGRALRIPRLDVERLVSDAEKAIESARLSAPRGEPPRRVPREQPHPIIGQSARDRRCRSTGVRPRSAPDPRLGEDRGAEPASEIMRAGHQRRGSRIELPERPERVVDDLHAAVGPTSKDGGAPRCSRRPHGTGGRRTRRREAGDGHRGGVDLEVRRQGSEADWGRRIGDIVVVSKRRGRAEQQDRERGLKQAIERISPRMRSFRPERTPAQAGRQRRRAFSLWSGSPASLQHLFAVLQHQPLLRRSIVVTSDGSKATAYGA